MPKLIAKTRDVDAYAQTDGEIVMYETQNSVILFSWFLGFITAISAIIIWAIL